MISLFKILRALWKTICATVYYYVTYLIPKDQTLWVFGSWKGRNYSDNSKALFEYVCKEHENIKAIWIAKNDAVYNEVCSLGYRVANYSSFKTKLLVARAMVNIQTESNEDTGKYRVGGSKVIQLFHGYGAIKEVYLFAGMGRLKKRLVKTYADNHTKSYWMVPSEYFLNRIPTLFEADKNRIRITGQPRIDILFDNRKVDFFENIRSKNSKGGFILYAPTHRKYGISSNSDYMDNNWDIVNDFCKKNDWFFFFKPHPLELYKYINHFSSYSNLFLLKNDIVGLPDDPYEYMHYFDIMISDYSSISTDYLVFDRPVIHFMYDFDTFADESFNLDALDLFRVGPICKNWDDVLRAIIEATTTDSYKELRKKARSIAFKYVDNCNCKRVCEAINSIVEERYAH